MVYEVRTRLGPEHVFQEARKFFGSEPGGLGMDLQDKSEGCVTFVGGGGHVSIRVGASAGITTVEIETREWDFQVKEFMRRITK